MSAPVERNRSMSCRGEDLSDVTRRRAGGCSGLRMSCVKLSGETSCAVEGADTSVFGWADKKVIKTEWICVASSLKSSHQKAQFPACRFSADLVGLMTSDPISFFLSLCSRRTSRSRIGRTKARVLPDPVTASTTTSLCFMKRGIVEA